MGKASADTASVWELAWPSVLAHMLQTSVGIVGVKAVGTLGADAVAAVTAGGRLLFVLQSTVIALGVGTTALIARAIGAGEREQAARVLTNSLVLAWLLALALGAIGYLAAEPYAAMFGLGGQAQRLATSYVRVTCAFAPMYATGLVISVGLRAAGDARSPLLVGLVSNLANVLFLYLLVYGWLGAPMLGVLGAGLSAGLAGTVGALLACWFVLGGKVVIVPRRAGALFGTTRALLRIGYPAALEQIALQGGMLAFTFIIARFYGMASLAAFAISGQVLLFVSTIGVGFSLAASTLVGQHLGAGQPARASQSGWRAMALSMGAMSALAVLIAACARPIARAMISDAQAIDLTVDFIYVLSAAQPLVALDYALAGALRGAGDTGFPLMSTITGLLGRVALASVLTWLSFPVVWIYGALLADYALQAVLLAARFRSNRWQRASEPLLRGAPLIAS